MPSGHCATAGIARTVNETQDVAIARNTTAVSKSGFLKTTTYLPGSTMSAVGCLEVIHGLTTCSQTIGLPSRALLRGGTVHAAITKQRATRPEKTSGAKKK